MERIPETILEDSRRSSRMVLIPQGAVRVGLSSHARELVQARILSRTKNKDLDEERTRKYLKNESPERTFFLSDFYMDQSEVTNRQYLQYARQSGRDDSKCSHVSRLSRPDASVVCVSWNEAQAFCRFYGMELPSEIQFEKAVRGTPENTQKPWHTRPQMSGTR
ncbi:SUMF1/EgtB/PvdO family nonheme iron enzyme, partial [bacterium]|nr:SUMF1/EgtB/PvdO family nonheme iron enzyme [bacterium]